MYAVSILDGEGGADERTAKLCHSLVTAIYNAVRFSGKEVPNEFYKDEQYYLPKYQRVPVEPPVQSWEEMKRNLGW